MPRLNSPSLKQLGLVPYNFPWRVEEHVFSKQPLSEDVHDPAILAEIWRVTRQSYRTDKDNEVPFNQSFTYGQAGNIRSSTTFIKNDLPLISYEIKQYIAQQVKFSLWGYINSDPRLSKYLVSGSPGGVSAPIRVEVFAGDQLQIKIQGPFWLQFYFTGARGHTIYGHNPKARNMLVFYGRTGDKIVTPSVYVPEIKPGLYIERAIADVLTRVSHMSIKEVDKDLKNSEEDASFVAKVQQAKLWLAEQDKWVARQIVLAQDRDYFLNLQLELKRQGAELSRITGDMRRRRQFIDSGKYGSKLETPDLDKIPTDRYGNAAMIEVRDSRTREWSLQPNPEYTGKMTAYGAKRTEVIDAYHKALAIYLDKYVTFMQLTGSNESRIRDIILPEHSKRKDYKLPSRQMVNTAIKKLRESGVKIKRRNLVQRAGLNPRDRKDYEEE